MNEKYLSQLNSVLSKNYLSLNDLTSDEVKEALEEIECRANGEIILDGYETELLNYSFRKMSIESQLSEEGLSISNISEGEYQKRLIDFNNRL